MKAFRFLAVVGFIAVGAWIGVELFRLNQSPVPATPLESAVVISVPPPAQQQPALPVEPPPAEIVSPPLPPQLAPLRPPVVAARPPLGASGPLQPPPPGEAFVDPDYGVSMKPPADWVMRGGSHWGKKETTLALSDPAHPEAQPSIYYKMYDEPMNLTPDEIEAYMRKQAEDKVKLRISNGLTDYTNRPDMITGTINGRPSLTWVADYTRNGQPWVEYMTRVHSPNGTIMYFTQAPAGNIPDMQSAIDQMSQTTVMP